MKVLCAAFLYLHFGFVICWRKNIGAKVALKMLRLAWRQKFVRKTRAKNVDEIDCSSSVT